MVYINASTGINYIITDKKKNCSPIIPITGKTELNALWFYNIYCNRFFFFLINITRGIL